jgi:AcrR family transcriptional regulator
VTNTEIVNAAFKVWGRNLYQKTSLSQLAKELKVSKPALYRHFFSKQALTDAMLERFFDDFTDFIRADYEQAMHIKDPDEGIFTIIRGIAGFYGRNVYAFIFSLMNLHNQSPDIIASAEQLKSRDVNMGVLHEIIKKEYAADSVIMQLIFGTVTFFMAEFHKTNKSFQNVPSEEGIQKITAVICEIINSGLEFTSEEIGIVDLEELEKRINEIMQNTEPEPFFKAVAKAVAKAGPWMASMDMVAQLLGLSKSSLYGHFKSRQDMLRQLFLSEFKRIISFARQSISLSSVPAEQLYLGIFSIAVYLRSRPEFLVALGGLRTRRLDLGKPDRQHDFLRLFEDLKIELIQNSGEEEKQQFSHWILFLLVSILLRSSQTGAVQIKDIQILFRFITLGLKGFKR